LLEQFVPIINQYAPIFSAQSNFKMAKIYYTLKNKEKANEHLAKAEKYFKDENQKKELNELKQKINEL